MLEGGVHMVRLRVSVSYGVNRNVPRCAPVCLQKQIYGVAMLDLVDLSTVSDATETPPADLSLACLLL